MAILLLLLPKAQVFQSSEIRVEAKDYILPSRGILSDVTHVSARVTLPFYMVLTGDANAQLGLRNMPTLPT